MSALLRIDLRSDTVTRPSEAMYEAMRSAPLGDDVLGDEPTVLELETLAAEMVGKEAALFVPSGTMGNQIALASHCSPGDAMIIEEEAHILYYEVGGSALLAGVVNWTIPSVNGVMDPDYIEKRITKSSAHTPGTALLCLENTHNRGGGSIIPVDMMRAYRELADRNKIKVHLDGARVFNAAVALGVDVKQITQHVDSVNFCLSKGLRSPVGSVLCGSSDFITKARVWRKRLGGGMRQAGILAACGIVSLRDNVERLSDDHRRAKTLGQSISKLPGLCVDMDSVQTNMVLVHTEKKAELWADALETKGLHCFPVATNRLRLVLHADIDDNQVQTAIQIFQETAVDLSKM